MYFNWKQFLDNYGIEYVTEGPNVKRDEIAIRCPYCGDDPSHHMGLNAYKGAFACWRNESHKGKRPEILVQRLLGCTRDQAKQIVGKPPVQDTTNFLSQVKGLFESKSGSKVASLSMPSHFKELAGNYNIYSHRFRRYLVDRGFRSEDIDQLAADYDLRYCLTGYWAWRLIIPVWVENRLVGWTGRTIDPSDGLRYKTLSEKRDTEGVRAIDKITNFCFPYDAIGSAEGEPTKLVIVEGPLDALKVDFYGKPELRALCVFGSSVSQNALVYITRLTNQLGFDKVVALLDETYLAMKAANRLSHIGAEYRTLDGGQDPGDFSPSEIYGL